ncbi:MAG TPA: peptidoglycan-binding domain-containing protein [Solirubrobacteraceae bacterium]|nr:peptidoglycan-binding domain-containing protein [Solirubrobacteraceae bacterium]
MRRTLLITALAAWACAPGTADAKARQAPKPVKAPRITKIGCLLRCAEGAPIMVQPGGKLQLWGRGLKRGMVASFPRKSKVKGSKRRVTAVVRQRGAAYSVTVPLLARSGRFTVAMPGGPASAGAGPVAVRKPPPVAKPANPNRPSGSSPFDTNVMWIWYVSKSNGGNLASIAQQAQSAGIRTLIIKASDGGSPFIGQFTPQLVATLHSLGLKVCGYSYVYGNNPAAEAAQGAAVAQAGADCLVIDAEGEYEGKYAAATTYIRNLRQAVGDSFPVAIAPFPYADYHQSFPYSVFLGPGGAQDDLPQMYWKDIGDSVDNAFDHTYTWHRIYERPIYPLGQTYSSPAPSDIVRFRQLAQAYGAGGVSWWDWQESGPSQWAAVSQALPPLGGFTPTNNWPALHSGNAGDAVVWLQMHLLAAGQPVTVNGHFDAATANGLRNLQTNAGLPVTGVTDPATWLKVLQYNPTAVDWTAQAAPARAAYAVHDEFRLPE